MTSYIEMARNLRYMLSVFAVSYLIMQAQCEKLQQVLILSRHNIRTPLTENLQYVSPNVFPKWEQKAGELTEKGALLEEYMGEYFHEWFVKQKFLPDDCPEEKSVFIYANTIQRTKVTAEAFSKGVFKNCSISVFTIDSLDWDPIFSPVPKNNSDELKAVIMNEMQEKLDALQLEDAYAELNDILNFSQSKLCEIKNICDLAKDTNDIVYEIGVEPNMMGPLALGHAVMDFFLMSYYDGKPKENVAWGKIKTPEQWDLLMKITRENQNVRFNSTVLAKELAGPLLKYMFEIFDDKSAPKLTILVGHDANLNNVMALLNFVPKDLPGQNERTPIGAKLVFQKWVDDSENEFLKVDYVYESVEQIRNASKLSNENPPQWVPMQIKNCTNDLGYCPWEWFLNLIRVKLVL